jgi:hypothetical protein
MAITREDLMRAGIGANTPMPTPAQAAPQRQGLLGGFFGPEGRDARSRLAIALEGMTLNPNQALIGQLQQGIESRETAAQKNATAAWLRSRGRDDLAAALEAGASPQAVLAEAIRPAAGPERGVVVGNDIVDPITGNIIYKGPEQEALIPAGFVQLDMQARAAGFKPQSEGGDGSYEEFMATRGSGLAAEARAIGAARGEATAAAPVDVATADTTLQLIADLRSDPGLELATGASSALNVVPGTPGYDFQNRVNQLLSGGFLTAIDQLRGMGSLSNAEGQTATRAISRMDTATSTPAFLDALADYEAIVQIGRERAAARIQAPAAGTAAQNTGTTTRLRFNEETGEFE